MKRARTRIVSKTPMSQILAIAKASMLTYGVGYIVLGITWIVLPTESRTSGIGWVGWLTPGAVGAAFVLVGAYAATVAVHRTRSLRITQISWLALTAMPGILSGYFLVAWIGYLIPVVESDAEKGIASTVSYLVIASGAAGMSRVSQIASRLQDKWEAV